MVEDPNDKPVNGQNDGDLPYSISCGCCLDTMAGPLLLYLYWFVLLSFGGTFDDHYLAGDIVLSVPIGGVIGGVIHPIFSNSFALLIAKIKKK